ncbi:MAG: hypothetical protein OXC82_00515 [Rhodobacteraceae bacterium]|nr:hypothetical protein [Paracoccaceae bacterium]MCY4248909.1 hypothetical protein [Paracoccaceae bacterium]
MPWPSLRNCRRTFRNPIIREYIRKPVSKAVEKRDDGACTIERDGRSWYRTKPSTGTLTCLFGRVEYQRSVYRNSTVGNSICPTDENLCLLAGRIATRLLAEMPTRTVMDVFDGFVGTSPAASTRWKLSRMVGRSWQNASGKTLSDICIGEDIPEGATGVILSLDGVHDILRPSEHPIGIAGSYDTGHKGNRQVVPPFPAGKVEPLHTIGSGWIPEHMKGTLRKWLSDGFKVIMARHPDLTSVGAADGAKGNRTFFVRRGSQWGDCRLLPSHDLSFDSFGSCAFEG